MSRLFRLAEIINYKYNLRIGAAEIPAPSKLVMTVKDNLIELYNNFFNEKSFLEKKVGVISAMNALFHLKGLSEPNTEELFHQMNKLISEIDKLDVVSLYKKVAKILDIANKMAKPNVIGDFLIDRSRLNRPMLVNRGQLLRGAENAIGRITKRLSAAFRILKNFVPEDLKLQEKGQPLQTGEVNLPARTLPEPLIMRFLSSPDSDKYHLTKDNWDSMYRDPRFTMRLVNLINSWERNDEVLRPKLLKELESIVKEFKQRAETNEPYLEKPEAVAPSASTSPTFETAESINLFDPFHSGKAM